MRRRVIGGMRRKGTQGHGTNETWNEEETKIRKNE
jgi:hypothetical protein